MRGRIIKKLDKSCTAINMYSDCYSIKRLIYSLIIMIHILLLLCRMLTDQDLIMNRRGRYTTII